MKAALVVAAALALGAAAAAAPSAQARSECDEWICGSNGPDPYGFAEAAASTGPVELTEHQMDRVTAGAGKVSMNDFHFVMRNNSSSPGLRDGGQVATTLTIVRGPGGFPVETVLLDGGLFEVQ
jgi:hypothetical protein